MLIHFLCLLAVFTTTSLFSITPQNALEMLQQGNKRYAKEETIHPNQGQERRDLTVSEQNPFATILCCSDSRVAPEIIFDQGIGDLFVVRVAGNVAGPLLLNSILYALTVLETPVLMVLGHENCGAVDAALKGIGMDNHIVDLMPYLLPAVLKSKEMKGDPLHNAIVMNVVNNFNYLKMVPLIAQKIKEKKLLVVGADFDLNTGKVTVLETSD